MENVHWAWDPTGDVIKLIMDHRDLFDPNHFLLLKIAVIEGEWLGGTWMRRVLNAGYDALGPWTTIW